MQEGLDGNPNRARRADARSGVAGNRSSAMAAVQTIRQDITNGHWYAAPIPKTVRAMFVALLAIPGMT